MQQLSKKIALLTLVASATAGVAIAQTNSPACNNALIYGNYGFTIEGTKLLSPPPNTTAPTGPQVGVAMTFFDGNGKLSQLDSVTVNGIQNPNGGSFTETPTNGWYSVNPDCTGSFTLNFLDKRPQVVVDFVVVDNGNEIDTVVVGTLPQNTPPNSGLAPMQGVLSVRSIGKRRFTPFGLFR